jgi:hypothetical protein
LEMSGVSGGEWREMRVVFAHPIEGGVYEQYRTQRAFY